MTTSFLQPNDVPPQWPLKRLQTQAALVRALVDELDRVATRETDQASGYGVATQLAEEVARLSCRMLECAAAMTGWLAPPKPIRVHSIRAAE